MNCVFNLESALFKNNVLIPIIADLYRYHRDVLHDQVHIISERYDKNGIDLILKYDLNPNGFYMTRTIRDHQSDESIIADSVAALELTPPNTRLVVDGHNKSWWIDNGFNVK